MIKNYVKTFSIWCLFDALYILIICHDNLVQYIGLFLLSIFTFIIFIIVFIPTILLLYFLFKKIINKNYRILITSLFVILTGVIYFLITKNTHFEYYAIILNALLLFWFLPLIFITTIFVSDKWLSNKKEIIKTTVLSEIIGFLVIFLIGCIMKGNPFEKYIPESKASMYITKNYNL